MSRIYEPRVVKRDRARSRHVEYAPSEAAAEAADAEVPGDEYSDGRRPESRANEATHESPVVKPRRGGFAQWSAGRARFRAMNTRPRTRHARAPLRKASASRLHEGMLMGANVSGHQSAV